MHMSTVFHVSFPNLGIKNITINREAFNIFGFSIYWYGLIIVFAVLLILFLALRDAPKFQIKKEDILDSMILMVPGSVIFARLYYVIFQWGDFKDNLLKIFDTRDGGLAFYGGVIGTILSLIILSKWKKIPISKLFDFFVVYIPLGQAIGRWGNFFNQEAFGTNTSLPWGMFSEGTKQYLTKAGLDHVNPDLPVHPTFLYEFIANMIIFFILRTIRKQSKAKFETLAWYALLYGIVRFFVESIRTDALFISGTSLRISMVLSAVMVFCAIGYLLFLQIQEKRQLRLANLVPVTENTNENQVEDINGCEHVDSDVNMDVNEPATIVTEKNTKKDADINEDEAVYTTKVQETETITSKEPNNFSKQQDHVNDIDKPMDTIDNTDHAND